LFQWGTVYRLFMAGIQGKRLTAFEWVWMAGSFALIIILGIFAIVVPMKFGEKRLSKMLI
jgi:Flp pilus assembly protein protease CpaA